MQQQGIDVAKSQGDFLMVVALYDTTGRYTIDRHRRLSAAASIVDPLARVNGVGNVQVFGGQYAMRIWLDPYKLQTLQADAVRRAQRRAGAERPGLRAARSAGCRSPPGQELERHGHRPVAPDQPPTQFKAIILKTQPDGSVVRLGDVARVELGADDYSTHDAGSTAARPAASPSSSRRAPTR